MREHCLGLGLGVYYSLWDGNENRFRGPILYDYTFPIRFPNIVFAADSLREAERKVRAVNRKIGGLDRFELSLPQIQRLATL